MSEGCGCEVKRVVIGGDVEMYSISRCRLHANAARLLEAAKSYGLKYTSLAWKEVEAAIAACEKKKP